MEMEKEQQKTWHHWVSVMAFYICVGFIGLAILQSTGLIPEVVASAWSIASANGIIAFVFDRVLKRKSSSE